jgi:hypothetical protein
MLAATFLGVGLCFQAEGNQFQHPVLPSYFHINQGMYSPSFVFIGKLLYDL